MENKEDLTYLDVHFKRLDICDCLFSSQRHHHALSNAKKVVKLAKELVELIAFLESKPKRTAKIK